jgi:hypothetical protein
VLLPFFAIVIFESVVGSPISSMILMDQGHKVGKTLANWVVKRRNMINDYLRGRACIESVRGS